MVLTVGDIFVAFPFAAAIVVAVVVVPDTFIAIATMYASKFFLSHLLGCQVVLNFRAFL